MRLKTPIRLAGFTASTWREVRDNMKKYLIVFSLLLTGMFVKSTLSHADDWKRWPNWTVFASSQQIVTGPGKLYRIVCSSGSTGVDFVQAFDTVAALNSGAVSATYGAFTSTQAITPAIVITSATYSPASNPPGQVNNSGAWWGIGDFAYTPFEQGLFLFKTVPALGPANQCTVYFDRGL